MQIDIKFYHKAQKIYILAFILYIYEHENSGLSSATNPKPKGLPSHCLLRQA